MGRWKLWFVLLLTFCTDNKAGTEILMKIIDKQPDVTRICSNETLSVIMLTVCKISTQRSRGEECRLLYKHGHNFFHGCDSRFTLMTENQTVFLHLTNLTAEDGGSYTCECVQTGGTYKLQLNVTVEANGSHEVTTRPTETPLSLSFYAVIGVLVVIIISGVILGFIHTKKCYRGQQVPTSHENTELYTRAEYTEPSVFVPTESELLFISKVNTCTTYFSV
ncbi:uncharacterized protein LOC120733245 [Simochromis diagramma]|uniref:uncharacterized protein LOC120733245 n=1 Tax=Simochromis diagramma TaxID=43689 RepID=UPI001A7ECB2B|nr:uncharacterized protein LOC120733245 [Simochromis diagramma]